MAGDSRLMTTHVTSVELDKNRNLKYQLIQTENAWFFSLVASMEIHDQERKREETEEKRERESGRASTPIES